MEERIGVVGLGRMGWALAARLAGQGATVSGWTRSGADEAAAKQAGFSVDSDLQALVARTDTLILSLFNDAAVRDVLGKLVNMDLTGKLVVETSTVSPDVVRQMSPGIGAAGGALIDAPISGGPEMVLSGAIGIFVGGDIGHVARFSPVAEKLSEKVDHVGPLGAGASAKIVNNMVLAGMWEALSEAVETGARLGLPFETILEFLQKSPAAAPAFQVRLPVIKGESDMVGFAVDGAAKDIGVILAAGRDVGLSLPAIQAVSERFARLKAAELGEKDLATVVPYSYQAAVMKNE